MRRFAIIFAAAVAGAVPVLAQGPNTWTIDTNHSSASFSVRHMMVSTVRGAGQPVWYLLAKDEGHGFQKKKNRDFLLYAKVMFVKQYLLTHSAPALDLSLLLESIS